MPMLKKYLFLFVLLHGVCCGLHAQQRTYYYITKEKWVDGVKEKLPNGETGHYYTFVNGYCYESDSQGRKLHDYTIVYSYQGENNESYWYVEKVSIIAPIWFLLASKDFSVLNAINHVKGTPKITVVLRRAQPPKPSSGIPSIRR